MRIWCALFLAGTVLAQDLDSKTLAGMEAEARGDWVGACLAFKAALDEDRDHDKSGRYRYARDRAVAFLGPEIDSLLKAGLFREAVPLVAAGLAVHPKYYKFKGAAKRIAHDDLEVPEIGPLADGPFAMRSTAGRAHAASMLGAPFGRSVVLVSQCLDFLAEAQEDDGLWDSDKHGGGQLYDAGVTGLAVLAILSQGKEGLAGPLGGIAGKGVAWLERTQKDDGTFGTRRTHSWIYNHVIATEAVAEYAILTDDVKSHRDKLMKARDIILDSQNPGKAWRYEPRGNENDTCVTVRAIEALHRLELAGLPVPRAAYEGASAWVDSMTDENFGQIGYNYPGGVSARPEGKQDSYPPEMTQAMTAAGTLVLVYSGRAPWELGRSLSRLYEIPPLVKYPDKYYWDLGARVFHASVGCTPYPWYEALVEGVENIVEQTGEIRGVGVWSTDGGRVYDAAMCVLALTTPYREPPRTTFGPRDFLRRGSRKIVYAADLAELPTGIYLDSGQSLVVMAEGTVQAERDGPSVPIGGQSKGGGSRVEGKYPFACLLGKIGPDGDLFRIDAREPITSRSYGQLFLRINEKDPRENLGAWVITLRPEKK